MQEFERGDSGFRSFVSVQSALVMYPIYTFGSEEQKQKWLPELAAGRKLGCFGLTEPGFGSNPGGMTTRARKVGDEYVLNGEKMWITSGTIADVAIIWAKVDDEDGKVRIAYLHGMAMASDAQDWAVRFSTTTNRPIVHLTFDEHSRGSDSSIGSKGRAEGGFFPLRSKWSPLAVADKPWRARPVSSGDCGFVRDSPAVARKHRPTPPSLERSSGRYGHLGNRAGHMRICWFHHRRIADLAYRT